MPHETHSTNVLRVPVEVLGATLGDYAFNWLVPSGPEVVRGSPGGVQGCPMEVKMSEKVQKITKMILACFLLTFVVLSPLCVRITASFGIGPPNLVMYFLARLSEAHTGS